MMKEGEEAAGRKGARVVKLVNVCVCKRGGGWNGRGVNECWVCMSLVRVENKKEGGGVMMMCSSCLDTATVERHPPREQHHITLSL